MMYLVIIGVALSALGLLAGAASLPSWRRRIAVALVGAVGVALLVANYYSSEQLRTHARAATRDICWRTAANLKMFELQRQSTLWTADQARWVWSGIKHLLYETAELCIPDVASCDVRMSTAPYYPRFKADLPALIAAFETGEPCPK